MNPLILLNWRLWAAASLVLGLAASHWKAYRMGGAEIRAEWAVAKLEESKQALRLTEKAIEKTTSMQADADQLRKDKNAQINTLNTRLAAALDGLRDRPGRPGPGDLPATTAAGTVPSCTGAGLYRPDAEFLVGEAARAKRLQLDLTQCQTQYNKVREALTK